MSTPIPPQVAAYRVEHRAERIGPHYRGWLHVGTTTVGALAAIAIAVWRVDAPTVAELAIVPIAFLIANFGEYLGHRGPMHHPRRGMKILFERHARQHHRFFTHESMAAESPRDFQMVLFPPAMLFFFIGTLAVPLGMLFGALFTHNAGWLFGATVMSYFLTYEWLHFSYHLPPDSWIGRRWLVRRLRRHHTRHHDQSRMQHENFNITFPIADWVMGTMARYEPEPEPSPSLPLPVSSE